MAFCRKSSYVLCILLETWHQVPHQSMGDSSRQSLAPSAKLAAVLESCSSGDLQTLKTLQITKKNITFNNNRNNQHYRSSTWSGCGHIHSRCAQRGFSRGEQRSWRTHLTGWCFIPSWLPLTSTWGGGLTHWLISSVCTWSLSPATAMTRCLWNTQIKII